MKRENICVTQKNSIVRNHTVPTFLFFFFFFFPQAYFHFQVHVHHFTYAINVNDIHRVCKVYIIEDMNEEIRKEKLGEGEKWCFRGLYRVSGKMVEQGG